MKRLHLLCNAHLDPYWLWDWEEGAAEALSTFRTAAGLCEEYDGLVFNHNEAILYQWVETYEPALFARIQRLAAEGKWRIMGGWYLQPDCNMPSGEGFVRQCLVGRRYFWDKFGVEPKTAINFDPFGHSRGLVQILVKAGYDSYIHCRPDQHDCPLPDSDYIWVGYDGSEIAAHRTLGWYGSPQHGLARNKVENYLEDHSGREVGLVLWGVGNHGGGPSRKDLDDLAALIKEHTAFPIVHSHTAAYFGELKERGIARPRHEGDLNAWAVGCYTSQVRLKQKYRAVENTLFMTEKMAAAAALAGRMDYPHAEFAAATEDMLTAQFHDVLPGSSVQAVEESGLRVMDHALEILSRVRARAYFALAAGQPRAAEGQIPICIYNPHPWPVRGIFEVEFNLPDLAYEGFTTPTVCRQGEALPCQTEKEAGNMNLDWRKRVVFAAELAPGRMNRFDCTLETRLDARPPAQAREPGEDVIVANGRMKARVSATTGRLEEYEVDGRTCIAGSGLRLLAMNDDEDPWSMLTTRYRDVLGEFTLMPADRAAAFSGVETDRLPAVRVVEDGPVRTVVEALFHYGDSAAVVTYGLPKSGAEVEVGLRVFWAEKDKALKLAVPSALAGPAYWGQVVFGRDVLPAEEREVVAQQWTALVSEHDGLALTCINEGVYGSDMVNGEMRLTLLRAPAYAGHPVAGRPIVQQDRFTPRHDQGERLFRLWLNAGPAAERMAAVEAEAAAHNQRPFALSFFPSGDGAPPAAGVLLDDPNVQLVAFKRAEDGNGFIIRLFEAVGAPRSVQCAIPARGVECEIALGAFEVKSLFLADGAGALEDVDLVERPLQGKK